MGLKLCAEITNCIIFYAVVAERCVRTEGQEETQAGVYTSENVRISNK